MKHINASWWIKNVAFWRIKGRSFSLCLGLLLLAFTFSNPDALGQARSASNKDKKPPKVKKVKTRNTKKSKSNRIKKVNPRSVSGRRNHSNKTVVPSYTDKKPVPAVKKVVPKSASGKVSYNNKKVSPRSATGKMSYKDRRVSPDGTPQGRRFKDRKIVPRSASGSVAFKSRKVVPRTITGQQKFKDRGVAPRSITGQTRYRGKGVYPRYSQLNKTPYNPRVQVRTSRGRQKFRVVTVTPRSIRSNPKYGSSRTKNRLLTYPSNLASTYTGDIKRKGRRRPGNKAGRTPASLRGAKKYNLVKVFGRSSGRRPNSGFAGKRGRFQVLPGKTGAPFAGNVKMSGRSPKGNDHSVNPRYSTHGQKRYKVVKVTPRSIPNNPRYKRTSNQNKLITYPKDIGSVYTGNIKSKRGFKHRTNDHKYISYRGNIKMREPKRGQTGTKYGGDIKRKEPKYQRLDKSAYIKGRSKAQWASFYRRKTRKQADFIGFQKYKPTKEKWMHPSAGYKVGRYKRTVEAKERTRKRNLWLSRMKKNDDQPKYLKMKEKKARYDPKEIKIWSDYDNSRGRAEGKKVKKNDK
ncbi:MAG: hypothetical protein MI921_27345 [Cytophagales bacterium]|nr:hypothetical protein [Cytophagales bacterium]